MDGSITWQAAGDFIKQVGQGSAAAQKVLDKYPELGVDFRPTRPASEGGSPKKPNIKSPGGAKKSLLAPKPYCQVQEEGTGQEQGKE